MMARPLFIAGALMAFTASLTAAEPVLSPRASANQIAVSGGAVHANPALTSPALGAAAKGKAAAIHGRVAGKSIDADLARAKRTVAASPRAAEQLPAGRRFEIAPLK